MRSALLRVCFIVAFLAKRSTVRQVILQFRIFVSMLDVVCCGRSDWQSILIQASVSLALFAEIASSPEYLLSPLPVLHRMIILVIRHFLSLC
jgi:hypothetical protein